MIWPTLPGLSFRYTKKKINFSFEGMLHFTNYEQLNKTLNTIRDYSFTNYYPRPVLIIPLSQWKLSGLIIMKFIGSPA